MRRRRERRVRVCVCVCVCVCVREEWVREWEREGERVCSPGWTISTAIIVKLNKTMVSIVPILSNIHTLAYTYRIRVTLLLSVLSSNSSRYSVCFRNARISWSPWMVDATWINTGLWPENEKMFCNHEVIKTL